MLLPVEPLPSLLVSKHTFWNETVTQMWDSCQKRWLKSQSAVCIFLLWTLALTNSPRARCRPWIVSHITSQLDVSGLISFLWMSWCKIVSGSERPAWFTCLGTVRVLMIVAWLWFFAECVLGREGMACQSDNISAHCAVMVRCTCIPLLSLC